MIAIFFGLLFGVPGVALLVVGLRGRRIDDHARCRGCGYDLSGHDATPDACPECGRGLGNSKRAIRIGHRRRRPVTAGFGALLLLITLGAIGTGVWLRVGQVRLIEHYPVWLLRIDLESNDTTSADAAMAELLRRYQLSQLRANDVTSLLADLLARHADPEVSWFENGSTFIETAWMNGHLSDEQMTGYVREAVEQSLVIRMRHRMREGGPIPVRIGLEGQRLSQVFQQGLSAEVKAFALRKSVGQIRDGDRVLVDLSGATSLSAVGALPSSMTTPVHLDLSPGVSDVTVTANLELFLVPSGDMFKRPEYSGEQVAEWQVEVTLPITVLRSDEQFIELVERDDPELIASLHRSLYVNLMDTPTQVERRTVRPNNGHGYIDVHNPPVNVAFRVFGLVDGVETELGTVARFAGQPAGSGWLPRPVREVYPDAESITVILRADREVAERVLDMDEIWSGELVVEKVLLR